MDIRYPSGQGNENKQRLTGSLRNIYGQVMMVRASGLPGTPAGDATALLGALSNLAVKPRAGDTSLQTRLDHGA